MPGVSGGTINGTGCRQSPQPDTGPSPRHSRPGPPASARVVPTAWGASSFGGRSQLICQRPAQMWLLPPCCLPSSLHSVGAGPLVAYVSFAWGAPFSLLFLVPRGRSAHYTQ